MGKQMLFIHWKTVRWALAPLVVASFALPLLSVRGMGGGDPVEVDTVSSLMGTATVWLPFFPVLAAAVGVILGLSAWHWDHRYNHVYALSLPISRARYATVKFGAGALLALLPAAGLMAGSLLAMIAVDIPEGLRAYPLQLAARFFIAIVTLYAVLFALAAGTVRTTVIVLSVVCGLPILALLGATYLRDALPLLDGIDVGYWITRTIEDFGPVRIFLGNWALIDV
jgi:hypothetical protein